MNLTKSNVVKLYYNNNNWNGNIFDSENNLVNHNYILSI